MSSVSRAEATDATRGDQMIDAYFRNETRKLADACLADIKTWDDWTSRRETYRQQLREMLGLDPLPERTPLKPVVTGTLDHDDFTVEKLHFQSRPGLYVTGNLYLPKNVQGKAPAILYVCGHSQVKIDGISYGNKVGYQHHGAWFAQNGFVCLVIDTLQLGEIEGIHHGTYREKMWWWNARGYTPAGVEAWNSIRAIDYLESRAEVDALRIGITGRSGGGAYSWYTAALDDRIKAAVPVAGITNLEDHVVHGCVEGHCDCMYFVNTYRWDYPQLAALLAPRPLLVANTDRDSIFPLEGVLDVHRKTRRLYELDDQPDRLGLQIAAGSHDDLQVLQLHALAWFNEHLRDKDLPIETVAQKYFLPDELKVFESLPPDSINAGIHETFVPLAQTPAVPETRDQWQSQRVGWLTALRQKCFAGWPAEPAGNHEPPRVRKLVGNVRFSAYDFESQNDITLRLYLLMPDDVPAAQLKAVVLHPLDEAGWNSFSRCVACRIRQGARRGCSAHHGRRTPAGNVWRCRHGIRRPARNRSDCVDHGPGQANSNSPPLHAAWPNARRHARVGCAPRDSSGTHHRRPRQGPAASRRRARDGRHRAVRCAVRAEHPARGIARPVAIASHRSGLSQRAAVS